MRARRQSSSSGCSCNRANGHVPSFVCLLDRMIRSGSKRSLIYSARWDLETTYIPHLTMQSSVLSIAIAVQVKQSAGLQSNVNETLHTVCTRHIGDTSTSSVFFGWMFMLQSER